MSHLPLSILNRLNKTESAVFIFWMLYFQRIPLSYNLYINTIISQENFIVTRALNIILDAVDIISRMHTVI